MSMPAEASTGHNQLARADREGSREVAVEGARVRYVDIGRGEPVLFLHGYPEDHRCWRHQITALSAHHRVIAPDWFGFGRSERRLDVSPEYEAEVRRVGAFTERLGIARFNLVCHDYGGYIGLGHLLRQPESVLRFAILNSRAHGIFTRRFYRFSLLQQRIARQAWALRLARAIPLAALHRRQLARYVELGCFSQEMLADYVSWMDPPRGRRWYFHFFAHYHVPVRPELAEGLARIACPTAVIWGDRDPYIPFSTAEELATRIPRATLTRLSGADHFVMEERPAEVTTALEHLLETPLVQA